LSLTPELGKIGRFAKVSMSLYDVVADYSWSD